MPRTHYTFVLTGHESDRTLESVWVELRSGTTIEVLRQSHGIDTARGESLVLALLREAAIRLHRYEHRLTPLIRWLDGVVRRKEFKRVRVVEVENGWRLISPERYTPDSAGPVDWRDPFGVRDIFVEKGRSSRHGTSSAVASPDHGQSGGPHG